MEHFFLLRLFIIAIIITIIVVVIIIIIIIIIIIVAKLGSNTNSVFNFQSMISLVELNSLFSRFFCYITWFVISPD